jgi:hypothetical protein
MTVILASTTCNVKLENLLKAIELVQVDYPSFVITAYSVEDSAVARSDFEAEMFGYPTYLALNFEKEPFHPLELTPLETFAGEIYTWYLCPPDKVFYPNPKLAFCGDNFIPEKRQTLDIVYSGESKILLIDSEYIYVVNILPKTISSLEDIAEVKSNN